MISIERIILLVSFVVLSLATHIQSEQWKTYYDIVK